MKRLKTVCDRNQYESPVNILLEGISESPIAASAVELDDLSEIEVEW